MPSVAFKYGPQPLNQTPLAASGNSTAISLPPKSQNMLVTFLIAFTLGSLTNCTVTPQVTYDGTTWFNVNSVTPAAKSASENFAIPVLCSGVKQVRLSYATTGTVTSSALVVDAVTQQA